MKLRQLRKVALPRLTLFSICLISVACTSYPFKVIYPAHYTNTPAEPQPVEKIEDVLPEIELVLPLQFQLAAQTGHLWCFRDGRGQVSLSRINQSLQKIEWGDEFSSQREAVMNDQRFQAFSPIGYPHTFCAMPRITIAALYDENWFDGWLTYFIGWENNELENQSLLEANKKLVSDITDTNKAIANVMAAIADYDDRIALKNQAISELEAVIADRNKKLAVGILVFGDSQLRPEPPVPPFDPKIEYRTELDPMRDIVIKHCSDVSDKTWANQTQMEVGPYIDHEFVDKFDELQKALSNPDEYPAAKADAALLEQLKQLKKDGFNLSVISGARTPWKQAVQYWKNKREGKKVAAYNSSDHLFGQAADIMLPKHWGSSWDDQWNSAEHQNLRLVLDRFGFVMNEKSDPVHVSLKSPSHDYFVRRLAISRAYAQRAWEIKQAQGVIRANVLFEGSKILAQKAQLEKDLQAKKNTLEERATLFDKLAARYTERRQALQRLDAEIARRAAEARNSRDATGAGRPWQRPSPNPSTPGTAAPAKDASPGSSTGPARDAGPSYGGGNLGTVM